jgi:serine/threonine protein kinase
MEKGAAIVKKQWFIDSKKGNIKDEYLFEKKLGSGGYGAVYLAKSKKSGMSLSLIISN